MSLTDITSINPNDLDAIKTLASIAHRLPELYSLTLEGGKVRLHVALPDARWLGPLLGLGEPTVSVALRDNPYRSIHDGAPVVETTRYEWSDDKFTVLGMDNRPVFEPADVLAEVRAVSEANNVADCEAVQ